MFYVSDRASLHSTDVRSRDLGSSVFEEVKRADIIMLVEQLSKM